MPTARAQYRARSPQRRLPPLRHHLQLVSWPRRVPHRHDPLDNATGASSYNIYYATTPGVIKAAGIRIPNVTSPHVVTPLTNGTTYYFVVTSVSANGESAVSSEVTAIPTDAPTGSQLRRVLIRPRSTGRRWQAQQPTIFIIPRPPGHPSDRNKGPWCYQPKCDRPADQRHPVLFRCNCGKCQWRERPIDEVSATPTPYPPPPILWMSLPRRVMDRLRSDGRR